MNKNLSYNRRVSIWLWIGVIMVIVQIVLGGITRLTDSGLSITDWEPIMGVVPPMSPEVWQEKFELYKATPQYRLINEGMSMSSFKLIYFWEFFHRFWGRLIGLVFFFPFILFLFQGVLDRKLIMRVLGAFGIGALVGLFGWIMVASGLTSRPWVNAYKLMLHLGLAVLLLGYMVFVCTEYQDRSARWQKWNIAVPSPTLWKVTVLIFVQILLGALMSGMKAGLFFPTWPTLNGEWLPDLLLHADNWTAEAFKSYDRNLFMPALVQFLHRGVAYLIVIIFGWFVWKYRADRLIWLGVIILGIQVILGIWTLLNSIGHVPLTLGVLHQLVGVLFFSYMIVLLTKKSNLPA